MKWIVRLGGLVLALVALLAAAVVFLPAERLAGLATDQLAAATGRDVAINGDVALTFWPVLGVSVDGLVIGNAQWAGPEPMFEAATAAIGVEALSLLRGDIKITNIEAQSPKIRLAQKLDGRANWQFADPATPGAAPSDTPSDPSSDTGSGTDGAPDSPARTITIAGLTVTDAELIYDAEGSDLVAYSGINLALDWPDPQGPATIKASVTPATVPVNVSLTVDGFTDFIAGEVSPLALRAETAAGTATLDGRASMNGAIAGRFGLRTADTDGFLRSLGLAPVGLPPKLGQSIDFGADITLTPDLELALRDLRVDLGGNVATGAVDLALAGTPRINAQLQAGALDLSSLSSTDTGGGGGTGSNTPAQKGWSTARIDASGLGAFNGDITLTAQSIDLGTFKLGETQTVLRNDASRLVFEIGKLAAYGGNVTGQFVVNNRSGLSIGGDMTVAGIQMQPLLADAIDLDRLTGQGDLRISFLGTGQSVDAIMRSLSGNGSLAIGRGTVEGINLDQLLRGEGMSGTTIFDDLTASWTIASGVLSNDDLLFALKNYSASGQGVVNLGARSIDYRFTPVALRANSGNGLAVPVVFKGPWSDVSIRPDLEAAFDLRLDDERRALEDRAKEALTDSLGVKVEEGQSTEDAVKEQVKDQLLRKLFD